MRIFWKINLAVLFLACGMLSISCGGGDEGDGDEATETKQIVVGFSQIGSESDWRSANTKSIKAEAEKRGVKLQFSDAQQKQQNQIAALRSFIAQKVDIIAFSPVKDTGWTPVLKEIKAAGIPVILTDRGVDSDPSLYEAFIGSDFGEEGRRAAQWLVKNTTGELRIAELQGSPGASCATDRRNGFQEVIKDHPRMKIILSQDGDFQRAKGRKVMDTWLAGPDGKKINCLYAHNDDMALGAIQAMKKAGVKPGKDVTIVSIDAVKAAFNAMIAGELNCTVECNPLLGPKLFDVVEAVLARQAIVKQAETLAKQKGSVVKAETIKQILDLARGMVPDRFGVEEGVFDQSTAKDAIKSRQY